MSLEFSECFTSFTTPKYNKTTMLYYFLIVLISLVIALFSNNLFVNIALFIILSLLFQGIYAIASHNEAFQKDVLPPVSDFGKIMDVGVKYATGLAVISFIIYLPIILIAVYFLSVMLNSEGSGTALASDLILYLIFFIPFFMILGIVFWYKYGIPAVLLFFRNLSLSDMLSFSKISHYGKVIRRDYWWYVLFFIILSLIINVVMQCILQLLFVVVLSVNTDFSQLMQQIQQSAETTPFSFDSIWPLISLGFLFSSVLPLVLSLLVMPNLNGQIIGKTIKRQIKMPNEYSL